MSEVPRRTVVVTHVRKMAPRGQGATPGSQSQQAGHPYAGVSLPMAALGKGGRMFCGPGAPGGGLGGRQAGLGQEHILPPLAEPVLRICSAGPAFPFSRAGRAPRAHGNVFMFTLSTSEEKFRIIITNI